MPAFPKPPKREKKPPKPLKRSRPRPRSEKEQAKQDAFVTLRQEVLARDGHRCTSPFCRTPRYKQALQCHHVIFRSHGGKDVEENLTSLCVECHDMVHLRVEPYLFIRRVNTAFEFSQTRFD